MKHIFEQVNDGSGVADQLGSIRLSARNRARANAHLRTANMISDGVIRLVAETRTAFGWTGRGIRELSRRIKASHV